MMAEPPVALLAMPAATSLLAADRRHLARRLFQSGSGGGRGLRRHARVLAPAVRAPFGARGTGAMSSDAGPHVFARAPPARRCSRRRATTATSSTPRRSQPFRDEAALPPRSAAAGACLRSSVERVHARRCYCASHPEGTPAPTPLLYNEAFTALAATSALGASCFVAAFRIAAPR